MAKKFLDSEGLSILWARIKQYVSENTSSRSTQTVSGDDQGNITQLLDSNVFYIFENFSKLTVKLPTEQSISEYSFAFSTSDTVPSLALPASVKWNNDDPILIEANHYYIVSILQNNAVYGGHSL